MKRKDSVCLAQQIAENEFYLIANACHIRIRSLNPESPHTDLLYLEDGEFREGIWRPFRRLNGDEANITCKKPTLLKLKVFAYS